jgi:uncharacterized protein
MRKAIGLLMLLMLAIAGNVANAQTFPALSGRVVDEANLLDPAQEAALTAKLAGLETRTKRQLVVTTLNSLQGYEISDYGYRLGRHWAIGQDGKGEAEKDNGTILIIAPNEHKLRIEVGYGLEPILTDGFASSVIRNDITPFFKAGDFAGGINNGVDKIITQIELPPEEAAKIAAKLRNNNPVMAAARLAWCCSGCLCFSSSFCPSLPRSAVKAANIAEKGATTMMMMTIIGAAR